MRAIETTRRWQELEPQIKFDPLPVSVPGAVNLVLRLNGPVALQRLESLVLRIRDDQPDRAEMGLSESGFRLSSEVIKAQVWGPFQFTPGVGPTVGTLRCPADEHGREVVVGAPREIGEDLRFQIEPTRSPWPAPHGVTARDQEVEWRRMVGEKIRLTVIARADGLDPWILPFELTAPVVDRV
jgi:hypothetical protein